MNGRNCAFLDIEDIRGPQLGLALSIALGESVVEFDPVTSTHVLTKQGKLPSFTEDAAKEFARHNNIGVLDSPCAGQSKYPLYIANCVMGCVSAESKSCCIAHAVYRAFVKCKLGESAHIPV